MNEQFSAFLDGEATRDETDSVINALLRDESLRESWSRQHWLRTTLRAHRGEPATPLDADFSSRVMQAIARDEHPEMVTSPPPAQRARTRRGRRRWRSMASLAAVASAAGIVLLVGNPLRQDTRPDGALASRSTMRTQQSAGRTQGLAGASVPAASMGGARPLSGGTFVNASRAETVASDNQVQDGPSNHWSVSDPAIADELNGYLVEHNGLARSYGLSGTTPGLVRVATYGQETTR